MCAAIISAHSGSLAARVHGLYAVTPDTADTAWLERAVAAAIRGGAALVQYRNKAASTALRREQAEALRRATASAGALLIVNDDPQLAADVEADGVHVGEDDLALCAARARVGARRLIGVSCYNDAARAVAAAQAGADYVAFGSFYVSAVKPDARRADRALLTQARALGVPLVAIGGITAENAGALRDAGADAIAVISAVFGPREPEGIERAARTLAAAFAAPAAFRGTST